MWKPPEGMIKSYLAEQSDNEGYSLGAAGNLVLYGGILGTTLLTLCGCQSEAETRNQRVTDNLRNLLNNRGIEATETAKPQEGNRDTRHGYRGFNPLFGYADDVGKNEVDGGWEEGPIEWASALSKQFAAGLNDIPEVTALVVAKGIDGIGYGLSGGEASGEANQRVLENAVRMGFNWVPGGAGFDRFCDYISSGDVEGAFSYARGVEDSDTGAMVGLGIAGTSVALEVDMIQKAFLGGESVLAKCFDKDTFFGKLLGNYDRPNRVSSSGRPGPTTPAQ
jgi:hypothetical protein